MFLFAFACLFSPATDFPALDTDNSDDDTRLSISADVLLISSAHAPALLSRLIGTSHTREHVRPRVNRRRSANRSAHPISYAASILLIFIPWLIAPTSARRISNGIRTIHEYLRSHIGEKRLGNSFGASLPARSLPSLRVTVLHAALSLFYFSSPSGKTTALPAVPAVLAYQKEGGILP